MKIRYKGYNLLPTTFTFTFIRRKRRQRLGANLTANSLRNLRGIPSGPDALSVLRDDNTPCTLRVEIIGGLIGLERGKGGGGGSGALESSREELAEKRKPKRVALSVREQAIDLSGRNKGGKARVAEVFGEFFG